jgi:hypothetical protein
MNGCTPHVSMGKRSGNGAKFFDWIRKWCNGNPEAVEVACCGYTCVYGWLRCLCCRLLQKPGAENSLREFLNTLNIHTAEVTATKLGTHPNVYAVYAFAQTIMRSGVRRPTSDPLSVASSVASGRGSSSPISIPASVSAAATLEKPIVIGLCYRSIF